MIAPIRIFRLYNDDKMVFEGTSDLIEEKYGIKLCALCQTAKYGYRAKSRVTGRMYYVRRVKDGKEENYTKQDRKVKPKKTIEFKPLTEDDEYYEVKSLLSMYGNTIVVKEPTELVERLKKDGINVWVKHYTPHKRNKKQALDENTHPSLTEDWVLTLC